MNPLPTMLHIFNHDGLSIAIADHIKIRKALRAECARRDMLFKMLEITLILSNTVQIRPPSALVN